MGKTLARARADESLFLSTKRKRIDRSPTTFVAHRHFIVNSWYRNKSPSIGLLIASHFMNKRNTIYEYPQHTLICVKMGVPSRKIRKRNVLQ